MHLNLPDGAGASPCKYMIQRLSSIYSYRIRIAVLSLIKKKYEKI
jgi:hypothetical protein